MSDFVWSAGGLEVSEVSGMHDYADTVIGGKSLGLRIENLGSPAKHDLVDLIRAGHTIRIVVEPKPFVPGYYRCTAPRKPGLMQSTPRPAAYFHAPPWSSYSNHPNQSDWERVEVKPA